MLQAEADIRECAINIECRRCAYPQMSSSSGVFLYSLHVDVIVHFIVVTLQIQTNLLGVLPEMLFL